VDWLVEWEEFFPMPHSQRFGGRRTGWVLEILLDEGFTGP
jgi:hypothetical protein